MVVEEAVVLAAPGEMVLVMSAATGVMLSQAA